MRTKLKDVVNGYVLERRFNIGEKLEDVRVERRPHQYLYHDGDNYQFMNQELRTNSYRPRLDQRCGLPAGRNDCGCCIRRLYRDSSVR